MSWICLFFTTTVRILYNNIMKFAQNLTANLLHSKLFMLELILRDSSSNSFARTAVEEQCGGEVLDLRQSSLG
jgi:hypothetical protein